MDMSAIISETSDVRKAQEKLEHEKTSFPTIMVAGAIMIFTLFVIFIFFSSDSSNNKSSRGMIDSKEEFLFRMNEKKSNAMISNVSIFYNIFLPSTNNENKTSLEDEKVQYALSLVKEQLQMKATSRVKDAPLYYGIIGNLDLNLETVKSIKDIACESSNCHKLYYAKSATEIQTLEYLYEHCDKNEHEQVIYIHDKGSFHPSKENDKIRKMLTKAVFSEECLLKNLLQQNNPKQCSCNMCSARFSPLPNFHSPGNMWLAECAYINTLLSPTNFQNAMDVVAETAAVHVEPEKAFFLRHETQSAAFIGKKRFAAEHWAYSHPSLCPCDVYPGPFLWGTEEQFLPETNEWVPNLSQAPRFPYIEDYILYMQGKVMSNRIKKRMAHGQIDERKFFTLAGRIHEWKVLYGILPQDDSWVWDYYRRSPFFSYHTLV